MSFQLQGLDFYPCVLYCIKRKDGYFNLFKGNDIYFGGIKYAILENSDTGVPFSALSGTHL